MNDAANAGMQEDKHEFHARDRVLLVVFVFGPLAPLLNLQAAYTLVPESCADGSKWRLHLIAAVFFVLCLISAFIARGLRPRVETGELYEHRRRWVALSAEILSFAGAIVIVAMEVPNALLGSCQ